MASQKLDTGSDSSSSPSDDSIGFLESTYNEIVSSPVNMILLVAIAFLLYKIIRSWTTPDEPVVPYKPPPKMKRRDMVLEDLKKYDGRANEEDPILMAVNGKIFNVTKGKRFYGPGGPYESLSGHDATRAFAKFQTDLVKEEYDDLSDLSPDEVQSAKYWEEQLAEKYDFVGRLIRPGEESAKYSDDEDEDEGTPNTSTDSPDKKSD